MNNSTSQLFFNYNSTSKIRIKRENCYEAPEYPCLYGIITKKLAFTIPKAAVIFSGKHIYIPLEIYRNVLINYYKTVKK